MKYHICRDLLSGLIEFSGDGVSGKGYLDIGWLEVDYQSTNGTADQIWNEVVQQIRGESEVSVSKLSDLAKDNYAGVVTFEGHSYRLVSNANTKYTSIEPGMVALFNVKSRGIRGVPKDTNVTVEALDHFEGCNRSIGFNSDQGKMTALEVEANKDPSTWRLITNAERRLRGFLEDFQTEVYVDPPLNELACRVMEERGFRCRTIYGDVPNIGKFYPPTVNKAVETRISWDRHSSL